LTRSCVGLTALPLALRLFCRGMRREAVFLCLSAPSPHVSLCTVRSLLPYRIIYAEEVRDHLRSLTARQRTMVLDGIAEQLTHEPTTETRNRKEMLPNSLASWELRMGDLRVYYDVTEDPQTVTVVAIGIKERNRVLIGGRERQL